jgi:hypothetical protein
MKRISFLLLLLGLTGLGVGCSTTRSADGRLQFHWKLTEFWSFCFQEAEPEKHDSEIDRLWRQGYGFNNPNAERIRKNQPPLNFDGTVYEP